MQYAHPASWRAAAARFKPHMVGGAPARGAGGMCPSVSEARVADRWAKS
ncbi:hypothetical protein AZ20_1561 [Bordetella bronchiseptica E014]|nr:hypothetical protein L576_1647 [Bordetella bronchiseptica OSU054]KAK65922.1 hypothetical protein L530_1629 [Bordetella bronchiseptica MO211]KAK74596.1 hypothetical protein L507_1624 [Bordetella bronchiseptica CA90 BB02]KCV24489.1 hypothetical protein L489_1773 [Bordetella bronchiseptica 00-P-2730]KCV41697.1 hypothetical protein L572_1753 [Bordetella bronchiseptica 345]KCV54416.1 hypothetical protein L492_1647 [Bordetella bronchiseptica 7E71]KDB78206.1 hypothetical protein L494_1704 [Bordet